MRKLLLATTALLALSGAASADTIFNFNQGRGSTIGTSETYTVNGVSITAEAWSGTNINTGISLYEKADGLHETGLGLNNDPSGDHEVSGSSFIRINFSQGKALGATTFDYRADSTSGNEKWALYGNNTGTGVVGTAAWTLLDTGLNDEAAQVTGSIFDFYLFGLASGSQPYQSNVLLAYVGGAKNGADLQIAAVPEASTWVMMIAGFFGIGGVTMLKRRREGQAFRLV